MKPRAIVLASMILMLSCSDSGTDLGGWYMPIPEISSLPVANELIIGHWEWLKSVGNSFDPLVVRTPESAGYTSHMVFHPNGTVDLYFNNQLVNSTTFAIKRQDGYLFLHIGTYQHDAFGVSRELLGWDDRPRDGIAELYVRRQ